jgi:malonate-semialdehyde dehydrogenase (acetylating)/methylmalonate-semialdehyde dehydrogenase
VEVDVSETIERTDAVPDREAGDDRLPVIGHWIGGRPAPGVGARLDVYEPSTGRVQSQVSSATVDEVDEVVGVAREAFGRWREVPLGRRAQVLFRFREVLERRKGELAQVVSRQHGKVLADALGEIGRGEEVVEYACGIPALLGGSNTPLVSGGVDVASVRQPVGVLAGITPFNFPAMVPMWMFPIAVACGNAFVLKPSEKDPGASVLLAEMWAEAGLPEGVFNVVQGDAATVDALLTHPGVDGVSFVGSTPVARHVYETAAATGKRVQALGGAKNHMVVLPDADLEAAADAAVSAGFGSAGQRCMAVSVVVAVGAAADPLVEGIVARAGAVRVGASLDPHAEMGPLVTAAHRDRVRGYVDRGVAEGAELVLDGREVVVAGHEGGFFLGPCVFDRVRPDQAIYRDEIFGPVLCVVRADTYDEALGLVQANPYGNGVAIFTRDGAAARRFALEVEVGMVGVNVPIPVPVAAYSFGGWRQSLFGDTHVHGPHGIHFCTRTKVITTRWGDPAARGPDLGFPRTR